MTAPQQTAPDGGEGIVGALAEALAEVWVPVDAPTSLAEALAATVARLIDDAVAERLAGVEALAERWARASRQVSSIEARLSFAECRHDLRAALDADSEPYEAPESAEQPSEAPGGRREGERRLGGVADLPRLPLPDTTIPFVRREEKR